MSAAVEFYASNWEDESNISAENSVINTNLRTNLEDSQHVRLRLCQRILNRNPAPCVNLDQGELIPLQVFSSNEEVFDDDVFADISDDSERGFDELALERVSASPSSPVLNVQSRSSLGYCVTPNVSHILNLSSHTPNLFDCRNDPLIANMNPHTPELSNSPNDLLVSNSSRQIVSPSHSASDPININLNQQSRTPPRSPNVSHHSNDILQTTAVNATSSDMSLQNTISETEHSRETGIVFTTQITPSREAPSWFVDVLNPAPWQDLISSEDLIQDSVGGQYSFQDPVLISSENENENENSVPGSVGIQCSFEDSAQIENENESSIPKENSPTDYKIVHIVNPPAHNLEISRALANVVPSRPTQVLVIPSEPTQVSVLPSEPTRVLVIPSKPSQVSVIPSASTRVSESSGDGGDEEEKSVFPTPMKTPCKKLGVDEDSNQSESFLRPRRLFESFGFGRAQSSSDSEPPSPAKKKCFSLPSHLTGIELPPHDSLETERLELPSLRNDFSDSLFEVASDPGFDGEFHMCISPTHSTVGIPDGGKKKKKRKRKKFLKTKFLPPRIRRSPVLFPDSEWDRKSKSKRNTQWDK